jgi:AhpD family alkylhydroperoxidase
MSEEVRAFYRKFEADTEKMKKLVPGMLTGFGGFFQKTMGEGKLTVREKELIAVGIAMAIQCKPCIFLHVKKCLGIGASQEEILEAAQVAVMMAGGPDYTHLPEVIDALEANQ